MSDNPYATPQIPAAKEVKPSQFPPNDQQKIEAIIKDAGQFWLAIILCLFCVGIGSLIVPIWYGVRLGQWNKLSKKYLELGDPHAAAGSLPAKFQSAQWKLIVGIVLGCLLFVCVHRRFAFTNCRIWLTIGWVSYASSTEVLFRTAANCGNALAIQGYRYFIWITANRTVFNILLIRTG